MGVHGVLVLSSKSGAVLFQHQYSPRFGLPADAVQAGSRTEGLALASLLHALNLQAAAAAGAGEHAIGLHSYVAGGVALFCAAHAALDLLAAVVGAADLGEEVLAGLAAEVLKAFVAKFGPRLATPTGAKGQLKGFGGHLRKCVSALPARLAAAAAASLQGGAPPWVFVAHAAEFFADVPPPADVGAVANPAAGPPAELVVTPGAQRPSSARSRAELRPWRAVGAGAAATLADPSKLGAFQLVYRPAAAAEGRLPGEPATLDALAVLVHAAAGALAAVGEPADGAQALEVQLDGASLPGGGAGQCRAVVLRTGPFLAAFPVDGARPPHVALLRAALHEPLERLRLVMDLVAEHVPAQKASLQAHADWRALRDDITIGRVDACVGG